MNDPGKTIVCAWAEHAAGPGWSNQLVWFIYRDAEGRLQQEAVQPQHQTREMMTLFRVSEAAHLGMTGAVRTAVRTTKRGWWQRLRRLLKGEQ